MRHQTLNGMPVFIVHEPEPFQHSKPRSKRRRIRKKWAKNPKNWTTPRAAVEYPQVLRTRQGLIMDRRTFVELKRAVDAPPRWRMGMQA